MGAAAAHGVELVGVLLIAAVFGVVTLSKRAPTPATGAQRVLAGGALVGLLFAAVVVINALD